MSQNAEPKEDKVELTYGAYPDFPDWPDDQHWPSVDGPDIGHLPTDVVQQDFALCFSSTTSNEDPRTSAVSFCLNFGGRHNPRNLTVSEATYLLEMLKTAVRFASSMDVDPAVPKAAG